MSKGTPTAEEIIIACRCAWVESGIRGQDEIGWKLRWLAQRLADALAEVERLRESVADAHAAGVREAYGVPAPLQEVPPPSDSTVDLDGASASAETEALRPHAVTTVDALVKHWQTRFDTKEAELDAAQQREKWWLELWNLSRYRLDTYEQEARGRELRRLLGLDDAAKEEKP